MMLLQATAILSLSIRNLRKCATALDARYCMTYTMRNLASVSQRGLADLPAARAQRSLALILLVLLALHHFSHRLLGLF